MDLDDVCVCTHIYRISPRDALIIHYTHRYTQVCLSVIVVPGYTGEHVCSVCAAHTHQGVRTPIPAVPWSYEDSPEINYVNIQGQFFMGTDFQSI